MPMMAVTGMINFMRTEPGVGVLIINNLLEQDFLQFMRRNGWEYITMDDIPLFYVGYIVSNSKAIKEIERRANLNPWFVFSEADKL